MEATTDQPNGNEENSQAEPEEIIEPAEPENAQDAATEEVVQEEDKSEAEDIAAVKEQLLRAMAETENIRKRAKRDVEDASKYAVASFARELISVLENLQRASESISVESRGDNEMLKNLGEGVDLTLKELLSTFEKHGITRINPLGEKFDHNFHQAVVQIEDPSHPPGTVVQVMQAGYVINDRLLRPAMVGVAKAPVESSDPPPSPVDTQV